MRRLTITVMVVVSLVAPLSAWGPTGHSIVADLADARLTAAARQEIRQLLGSASLASIASWPDDIRKQRPETYYWHFVDIPNGAQGFDEQRDCFHPESLAPEGKTDHHNCVVDRIEMFTRILADPKLPKEQRAEALKFVVHFIGDIHQPLHAVGEARGGNDVKVSIFGVTQCGTLGNYPCNLHWAWDQSLIDHSGYSEQQYVQHLEEVIRTDHLEQRAGGTPADWANESFHAAEKIWLPTGGSVDDNYYRAHAALLDQQLALAGIRLARVLNEAFAQEKAQR